MRVLSWRRAIPAATAAVLALSTMQPGAARADQPASDLQRYQALADLAGSICRAPQTYGFELHADGKVGGQFDISKLIRNLASLGVSLDTGAGASVWRGVLQRDLAAALTARNQCASDLFKFLVVNSHDNKSGRRLRQPPRASGATPYGTRALPAHSGAAPEPAPDVPEDRSNVQGSFNGDQSINVYRSQDVIVNRPPPNSEDEDRLRLKQKLSDLANFPEQDTVDEEATFIERINKSHSALHLFLILKQYPTETMASIPAVGARLVQFWSLYTGFRNASLELQKRAIDQISSALGTCVPEVCERYYKYAIYRCYHIPPSEILKRGLLQEANIPPTKAEKVFLALVGNDPIREQITDLLLNEDDLQSKAQDILSESRRDLRTDTR